ncbi:MAG: competence/damage-inducible protein A [Clostridia bacterium]|nr:competence/damage-inducible protein A [Clostridia bacterium]
MKACILSVGTELLMGSILNTNTKYLSEKLNEYGIAVLYHVSVGDNPERVKAIFDYYLDKVDVIIATGGLGPTQDDLTKEVISEAMGCELIRNDAIYEKIEGFFTSTGRVMTANNAKQALVPDCGMALENDMGTAPGIYIGKNDKHVFLLPGPPREMTHLFELHVGPMIAKLQSQIISSKYIKVFGMGESAVEDRLLHLINGQVNPTIATYAKRGEIEVRVTASGKSLEETEKLLAPVVAEIQEDFGEAIYSIEGGTLAEIVGNMLIEKGVTLSLAESCTGGLLAGTLTSISGISSVLHAGFVTYSNEAKVAMLGVSEETLKQHGAVSEETALEMIQGLKSRTDSDVAVSITGIAGPGGGTAEKPVGLVYIGIAYFDSYEVHKFNFTGDRERVRDYTVLNALNLIRKKML